MNKVKPETYVKRTILTADKDRIARVLNRYWEYRKEKSGGDLYHFAQQIFRIK